MVFVFLVVLLAACVLGVVRGVGNGSVLHTLLSVFVPLYGLFYFLFARRPPTPPTAAS